MKKMSMSRSDFNNALRESISSDFMGIPTNENIISYTFSDRFVKKMEKLIRLQKKAYYNIINTNLKRIAIVCLVAVLLLVSTGKASAICEPIVKFFVEIYKNSINFSFQGDTTNKITKEYEISFLPEGFQQTDHTSDDIQSARTYENDRGNMLIFSQRITENTEHDVDNEHGDMDKIIISSEESDKEVYILNTSEVSHAVWIEQGYMLSLTYYGNISVEELITIIESVE